MLRQIASLELTCSTKSPEPRCVVGAAEQRALPAHEVRHSLRRLRGSGAWASGRRRSRANRRDAIARRLSPATILSNPQAGRQSGPRLARLGCMPPDLRDVTRDFGRGQTTLESWRGAARAERDDRQLAAEVLKLIADWENSAWRDSVRSREDLRARAKQLVPAAPAAPPASASRRGPKSSIYDAGLRGQRRRT